MDKKKSKILTLAITLTFTFIIGFYFSAFINLVLSQSFENFSQLKIATILKSLVENKRHRLLFFATELMFLAFSLVIVFTSKKESFESDTLKVTETIKTPISIGQGQHGTSKWLDKSEQKKVFNIYGISKEDYLLSKLIECGENDRKEVISYHKQKQTTKEVKGNKT